MNTNNAIIYICVYIYIYKYIYIVRERESERGSILESKGMHAILSEKGQKSIEKGKIFESFDKNVQNFKIF